MSGDDLGYFHTPSSRSTPLRHSPMREVPYWHGRRAAGNGAERAHPTISPRILNPIPRIFHCLLCAASQIREASLGCWHNVWLTLDRRRTFFNPVANVCLFGAAASISMRFSLSVTNVVVSRRRVFSYANPPMSSALVHQLPPPADPSMLLLFLICRSYLHTLTDPLF